MDRKAVLPTAPATDAPSPVAGFAAATPLPTGLRSERDRFVAFAFAAADLLLELDAAQSVVFAAGPTAAFAGLEPTALKGKNFLDLVAAVDRPMIRETLAQAARGRRIRNVVLRLQSAGADGAMAPSAPLSLLGYQLPDMGGRYYLSLRAGGHEPRLGDDERVPLVTGGDSGLPNPRSFAVLTGERLGAAGAIPLDEAGRNYRLSLLRFAGLNDLRHRLEREARGQMAAAIGGGLRALAVNGDLAGQFDGECFGVVHAADVDLAAFETCIVELSRRLDPQCAMPARPAKAEARKKGSAAAPGGVAVARAVVEMDVSGMAQSEQVKALAHIVNRFTDGRSEDFKIASVSAGHSAMIGETVHRLAEFRSVVAEADFVMAFQPIVDLSTRDIHHYEVLARFPKFGNRLTPYEAITFAEQTGLIFDFDLAMCAKALAWLEARRAENRNYELAVNLSGSSIGTPAFVKALHKLLQRHDAVRRQLAFEITESAHITNLSGVNAIVRSWRAEGHKVCLDDFGAGASAFHYLRALEVDVVKIDGAYVRDASRNGKSAAFLKAMANLCGDLGIATVAEMVEDESNLAFLRQCGVDYGQGWLFGKPSADITDFERQVPAVPRASRRAGGAP